MSDDTDDDVPYGQPSSRRKSKKRILSSDSSSSSSSNSPILRTQRNAKYRVVSDDSESDSSDSFNRYSRSRKRKKVALIMSDSEDDSDASDIIIVRRAKRVANIVDSEHEDDLKYSSSQWETDEGSDNEEKTNKTKTNTQPKKLSDKETGSDTDSSGRQSEECPICLVPIKKQELGTPESCDHIFCLACILEWSKNVNTCPIDRQEYKLVFVKDKVNGKVVRRIPIEKPAPPGPVEDPICCEICGSGDREDRLLLCDGCDQGFHLECLTPPLQEVPTGSWFCNVCRPEHIHDESFDGYPSVNLLELLNVFHTSVVGRRRDSRLIPRTRQTERVISRILNHRISTENAAERLEQPSNSQRNSRRATAVQRKKTKRRKRKAYRKKYRMVYEVDEVTGDVISKKKQVRVGKRKTRKSRNKTRVPKPPKTVKKRLAQQLGICRSQLPNQNVPDVRVQSNTSGLNNQRYQAGIPTLHLFGQRDEIDYFSASEEDMGGPGYLVRRRANHSDVSLFRRAARRKGVLLPQIPTAPVTSNTSTDLLDSIMNSQSQFFSKSAKFSVDNSGKFKIENNNNGSNSNNKPDLKQFNNLTRKTPYGGNNRNNDKRGNQQPYPNSSYQGGSYYPYDSYGPSSTSENFRSYPNSSQDNTNNTGGGYDQDMPQDYTQSTLSSYDRDIDFENNRNEQGEESDIDIYSDIEESVSTSKIEEDNSMKPLNLSPSVAPIPVPNIGGSDNENNDSDNEMVIDTEKVETPTQDEEEETVKEETAVTSSEDTVAKCTSTLETPIGLHSTSDNQSEEAESSFNRSREDEEDEDEDGCPNFNIYSTESINLAKNTDITLNPDENNQVVSTTPLPEPPKPPPGLTGDFDTFDDYDPDIAYDPEAAYNSEKESEAPQEEAYDPERVYDTPEDTCEPEKVEVPDSDKTEENHEPEIPDNVEVTPKTGEECSKDESEEVDEQNEETENETKEEEQNSSPVKSEKSKSRNPNALYSDSEDEEVVKISQNSFIVGDISTMTEDVSEEERSYTPCLDEKDRSKGLDDLGTEMISDDEKNDFDESHEHKTASEGDALEINAKESEIDMVRPEDYEEGEIVDKNKAKNDKQDENANKENQEIPAPDTVDTDKAKNNKKESKKNESKEKQESFKKLSKSNKERNYRDKERSRSPGKADKSRNKNDNKEKRKDKRKEIERYDVRALIAEKPRRLKDKFGRDIRKSSSRSRSRSRSYTPKNSPERRTPPKKRASSGSRERLRKKRSRSRRKSSGSRSKSRQRRRSLSRTRRRRSRSRSKLKKSKDRSKRRKRERSVSRTYTPTRKRRKDWENRYSRERAYSAEARWTPSLSRTPDIETARHMSPSWTPPRVLESAAVDPRGLTVILQNDQNKKKKDKRKKNGKKGREADKRSKRKKKEHTPQPSKEVFASGDNILVSVSFNKENERRERDVFTKKKKEVEDKEKKKRSMRRKKKNQELSTIKPVAIIDLERSPFRELTPSPKDVIVLSDEDQVENNVNEAQDVCDSSQQVASPESVPVYMTGPKTPPEPQVKFSLPSKQTTLRPLISNPLHDPEDEIADDQEREEDQEMMELNDNHKGPNTPPEPPNSPPSSPDAYDPFEPTKSRSPSPEVQVTNVEEGDKRNNISDLSLEKSTVIPSMTPPIADVQPADSQSSLLISRDSSKSPEQVRSVQQSTNQSFTPASNALTSTPLPSSVGAQRINILSSTILGSVSSTIPQRATLPNVVKLSPVKISPVKNQTKSTPNKSGNAASSNKSKNKSGQQNGGNDTSEVISLDFDSPYSPGSSDYEDLFEPPPEVVTKKSLNKSAPAAVGAKDISSSKPKNTFDSLFDTPMNKMKKADKMRSKKADKMRSKKSKGTKIVGVKLDEDHLKILDELPNSAVEMQVKDKFLKKLNRQERVVEEVKLVLKPYYNKKKIDKEEYKDIMRRAVPKICHNKSGEINPNKIKNLVEAYVRKMRHAKPKVTSSSSYNPLKG